MKVGQVVTHTDHGTMPFGKVVSIAPKSHGDITFKHHQLGVLIDTSGYANVSTSKLPEKLVWAFQGYLK